MRQNASVPHPVTRARPTAAAVAGVLGITSGAIAGVAPVQALPDSLLWMATGWGWVTSFGLLVGAGWLTFLSTRQERPTPALTTKSPLYEETITDSVGMIRRVVISDRRVAETYIQWQRQRGAGDG